MNNYNGIFPPVYLRFNFLVKDFEEHYCYNLDPKTVKSYLCELNTFKKFIFKHLIDIINHFVINDYFQMIEQTYAAKTYNRKLSTIQAFTNHIRHQYDYPAIYRLPRRISDTTDLTASKGITVKDYKKLAFAMLKKQQWQALCLIAFMASTGCRLSELQNVYTHQIKEFIKIKKAKRRKSPTLFQIEIRGKGKKRRYVYLPAWMLPMLEKYVNSKYKRTEYLFPCSPDYYRCVIKRFASDVKVSFKVAIPHSMRHLYKFILFHSSLFSDNEIRILMGHQTYDVHACYSVGQGLDIQRRVDKATKLLNPIKA